MRVLFITGEFPPMQGGVGDCTNEIAKELGALGLAVQVLTSTGASQARPTSFTVRPVIEKWNWAGLRTCAGAIRDFAPDIVHIQYQTGAFGMHPAIDFAPRLLQAAGTKFVVTFHDLRVPYLFPKAGRVRDWVTHELARSSNAVVATNDDDLSQLSALRLERLTLIPIGSNISTTLPKGYDRSAWRAQLGVAANETLLCYFGFLNASKGGETLIRALALVPNAKLLMIGEQVGASDPTNAAYLAQVKALIADLGLSDRVIWTGYAPAETVTAHFTATDLCVMPYRDGASYRRGTLMAALAHGMPLITTQAKSKPRNASVLPALSDGENCLLVPPDDPPAIAAAIQRAISSPELCVRISTGARELAQHFTWDRIAQQHLELYKELVQRLGG